MTKKVVSVVCSTPDNKKVMGRTGVPQRTSNTRVCEVVARLFEQKRGYRVMLVSIPQRNSFTKSLNRTKYLEILEATVSDVCSIYTDALETQSDILPSQPLNPRLNDLLIDRRIADNGGYANHRQDPAQSRPPTELSTESSHRPEIRTVDMTQPVNCSAVVDTARDAPEFVELPADFPRDGEYNRGVGSAESAVPTTI